MLSVNALLVGIKHIDLFSCTIPVQAHRSTSRAPTSLVSNSVSQVHCKVRLTRQTPLCRVRQETELIIKETSITKLSKLRFLAGLHTFIEHVSIHSVIINSVTCSSVTTCPTTELAAQPFSLLSLHADFPTSSTIAVSLAVESSTVAGDSPQLVPWSKTSNPVPTPRTNV